MLSSGGVAGGRDGLRFLENTIMAFMSQQRKAAVTPAVKNILKKYGLKGTLSVRANCDLVLKITKGPIDFIGTYNKRLPIRNSYAYSPTEPITDGFLRVGTYNWAEQLDGPARDCVAELVEALNVGNHNRSDIQTDYFDVGWYTTIYIGAWNKAYEVTR